MLKSTTWYVFFTYEIDPLLQEKYDPSLRCYDLMRCGEYCNEEVGGSLWDPTDPEAYYDPAMIHLLTCTDVRAEIQTFNAQCPYTMPSLEEGEDPTILQSHEDLIDAHGEMYASLSFWMSRLMLDGHIEKVDEYYVIAS